MSAVAIQYDPIFSMGHRSTFFWPGTFESGSSASNLLGQDFSSILPPLNESSISPYPKALTSSPPQTILATEQRELKKQRDRVRRDSRASVRLQRANSNPYASSPPMTMPDVSSAMALPAYTTAPAPASVQPATTTLVSQPYLTPYSPPLQDQTQVFSSPYQQPLQPNYDMSMEYPATYAGPSDYSISPSSGSDGATLYQMPAVLATGASANTRNNAYVSSQESSSHVRVVQSRPKPRCWDHGCSGRQFSTFSNLLRHQREKSGQAVKATCPNCGAEFTRTTARNGHLLHDKCKQRRNS